MSRSEDLGLNEKVCIFHHSQHQQFRKRSSILKLSTPQGVVTGHDALALALESNVADHLLNQADLLPAAQEILLKEIEQSFSEDNNSKLKAIPTKSEIKQVLDSCRPPCRPRHRRPHRPLLPAILGYCGRLSNGSDLCCI